MNDYIWQLLFFIFIAICNNILVVVLLIMPQFMYLLPYMMGFFILSTIMLIISWIKNTYF